MIETKATKKGFNLSRGIFSERLNFGNWLPGDKNSRTQVCHFENWDAQMRFFLEVITFWKCHGHFSWSVLYSKFSSGQKITSSGKNLPIFGQYFLPTLFMAVKERVGSMMEFHRTSIRSRFVSHRYEIPTTWLLTHSGLLMEPNCIFSIICIHELTCLTWWYTWTCICLNSWSNSLSHK